MSNEKANTERQQVASYLAQTGSASASAGPSFCANKAGERCCQSPHTPAVRFPPRKLTTTP